MGSTAENIVSEISNGTEHGIISGTYDALEAFLR